MVEPLSHDSLTPPLKRIDLPKLVQHQRDDAKRLDARISKALQPRIDEHLRTYALALDEVEHAHQAIADQLDFDLKGETQWAAMWQVAGRCIGFARALLVLAHGDFGDEGLPTARSMHEANRMLQALADPDELDLVQRWLEDHDKRYVHASDAREAVDRIEARLNTAIEAAGHEPVPTTLSLTRQLYHRMSLVAHIRRQAIEMVVSSTLRRMSRGRHPDPIGRAIAVESHGRVIQETVATVGDSFGRFYGPSYYEDHLWPLLASFDAVRNSAPLDPKALRGMR
ncbi:MAG: hypothetical protein ACJ762_20320 [Solirubrobacteraceae bacterium]